MTGSRFARGRPIEVKSLFPARPPRRVDPMRSKCLLPCVALAIALIGCETTVNGRRTPPKDSTHEDTIGVSPFVAERIDRTIRDVPYLQGRQVVEASAEMVKIGPSAIPKLLEAVSDPEASRRVFAINVLGALGNRTVLATIHARLEDGDPSVRYEAARACARLGDWIGMPVLIAGLRDSSEYARTLCHDALRRHTHMDFGYLPKDAETEREKAAEKWQEWWASHSKATLAARS